MDSLPGSQDSRDVSIVLGAVAPCSTYGQRRRQVMCIAENGGRQAMLFLTMFAIAVCCPSAFADGVFVNRYDSDGNLLAHRSTKVGGEGYAAFLTLGLESQRIFEWEPGIVRVFDLDLALQAHIRGEGYFLGEAADGGFFYGGCSQLAKMDSTGAAIWIKRYDVGFVSAVNALVDGRVLVAGNVDLCERDLAEGWGNGPFAVRLALYQADGESIWDQTLGEEASLLSDVLVGTDGEFYLGIRDPDRTIASLVKFGAVGDRRWTWAWPGYQWGGGTVLSDGSVVLAGTESSDDDEQAIARRIGVDGTEEWATDYCDPWKLCSVDRVLPNTDGGTILVGSKTSTTSYGQNLALFRLDSNGNPLWEIADVWQAPCETSVSVALVDDGDIVVAGRTRKTGGHGSGPPDTAFLSYYNAGGQLVWRLDEEFVKGSEDTEAGDGAIDDGGNIWIVGTYATSGDEEKDRGCGC